MPSLCLYFQLHQPRRLRRYTAFDGGADYFDERLDREILLRVADRCYLPALRLLKDAAAAGGEGTLRLGLSVTGTLVEQLERHAPSVIDELAALAATGNAEFLSETHDHSLASFYDLGEFEAQVAAHRELLSGRFGQEPTVFRNTELLYSDALAEQLAAMGGYAGVLTEGSGRVLGGRSPNRLYAASAAGSPAVLLRNQPLSDAIGYRFGQAGPRGGKLTPEGYAKAIADEPGDVVNVFADLEAFGEHQAGPRHTFDFLAALPAALAAAGVSSVTPAEAVDLFRPVGRIAAPKAVSWADEAQDLSAWLGNAMQASAARTHFALADAAHAVGDAALLRDWRRLSNSDHLYYMATKSGPDQEVHDRFSPYDSPYDAYINYMNVIDSLRNRLQS